MAAIRVLSFVPTSSPNVFLLFMPDGGRLMKVGTVYVGEIMGACFRSTSGTWRKYKSLRELEDRLELAANVIVQQRMRAGQVKAAA